MTSIYIIKYLSNIYTDFKISAPFCIGAANPAFIVRQYPILQKAMYQSSNVSSGTFYDFILVFSSFNLCVSQKELTLLKT